MGSHWRIEDVTKMALKKVAVQAMNDFTKTRLSFGEREIVVLKEEDAKKAFKKLRKKGFVVDIGKCTGNIWTPERRKKITWMLKDFQNQWCIEII